ncbi:MAG: hypothetical protein ACU0CB_18660 [Roseovarius sp.]|uniref:hypothetical protein n=1 Tax=Roseovarius sp. TaxID=1486281 RepID=UPI0026370205|nr:hypothetical protein [Roseovarius sp.]
MIRAAVLALGCALGGPALALSCLPPDVAETYRRAAEAEETYIVVQGRLTFDPARLPGTDMIPQQKPAHTLIPARLTGQALTKGGFDQAFDRAITLDVQCFGPWCASAVPGAEYLGFLERRDGGYVLTVDPCGGMSHPDPTPAMLDKALECLQGGPCMRTRR